MEACYGPPGYGLISFRKIGTILNLKAGRTTTMTDPRTIPDPVFYCDFCKKDRAEWQLIETEPDYKVCEYCIDEYEKETPCEDGAVITNK